MHRITLALLGAAVVAAMAAVPSRSTPPGENGRLVFSAEVGQHTQLFSVLPDGSGLKQLTRVGGGSDALNANWSPDGSHIAFERDFPYPHAAVYTMNANGGGSRDLTPNRRLYFESTPVYSPDGRRIVFLAEKHYKANELTRRDFAEIDVMNTGGAGRRRVAPKLLVGLNDAHHYGHSQFSPDGQRLVFIEQNGDRAALFVINLDGTGMQRITPWKLGVDDRVDWSPDGSLILFSSDTGDSPVNVYTVHPDGTGLTQITHSVDGNDSAKSWSPDGKRVMVVRAAGGIIALYTMSADGSDWHQVTHRLVVHGGAWGTHP
jgi:TolB protein